MADQQADDADSAPASSEGTEPGADGEVDDAGRGRHAAPEATASDAGDASDVTHADTTRAARADTTHAAEDRASEQPVRTMATPALQQARDRNGQDQTTTQTTQNAPTVVQNRAEPEPPARQAVAPQQHSLGIGDAVWKVLSGVATAIKVVCYLIALVLIVFIVLSLVGVNPQNGVAQFVGACADAVVLDFRDLFLPADPRIALVVDYGLAAVFWLVVGTVVSRVIRFVARQIT